MLQKRLTKNLTVFLEIILQNVISVNGDNIKSSVQGVNILTTISHIQKHSHYSVIDLNNLNILLFHEFVHLYTIIITVKI